ncbi:MAG: TlpA family protein disulfide reductase, partial [Xanthomonadales bacterium]|nr:TlpA family protein disulfide reductase [Xanthomonadales bacterium]
EHVQVPDVRATDQGWILRFPAFNNTITLNRTQQGFEGQLTLVKRGYEQTMQLIAIPDKGYRFLPDPEPQADFTGRWEVGFIEKDGTVGQAVGEFDQQGSRVSGTFLTPTGDYRFLAGDAHGDTLLLSTFDGAHAFVFKAVMLEDGSLKGDFWSGTKWHQPWTAERNYEAQLPDAYTLTYLKEGYERLEFQFPDLSGQPVSLLDDKYQGKVVLVSLAGSWCPNCADEMEFLSGVYQQYRDQGLEIICLLYEHFEDFELAAAQGVALEEKHDIDFDILVAGTSDKTKAAETLPMLNQVLAFPTLIFIDRGGNVRGIHTGFAGPGTGRYFAEFKEKFTAELERLLAEDMPIAGP